MAPNIAFFSFRAFRRFRSVEEIHEVYGQKGRVEKDAFGTHGMSTDAVNGHNSRTGVEGFINHFPQFARVDGIGKVYGKTGKIHVLRPVKAAFFIRYEGYVNIAVVKI